MRYNRKSNFKIRVINFSNPALFLYPLQASKQLLYTCFFSNSQQQELLQIINQLNQAILSFFTTPNPTTIQILQSALQALNDLLITVQPNTPNRNLVIRTINQLINSLPTASLNQISALFNFYSKACLHL